MKINYSNIKQLRERAGLTQADLVKKTKIGKRVIQRWEQAGGRKRKNFSSLSKVSEFFVDDCQAQVLITVLRAQPRWIRDHSDYSSLEPYEICALRVTAANLNWVLEHVDCDIEVRPTIPRKYEVDDNRRVSQEQREPGGSTIDKREAIRTIAKRIDDNRHVSRNPTATEDLEKLWAIEDALSMLGRSTYNKVQKIEDPSINVYLGFYSYFDHHVISGGGYAEPVASSAEQVMPALRAKIVIDAVHTGFGDEGRESVKTIVSPVPSDWDVEEMWEVLESETKEFFNPDRTGYVTDKTFDGLPEPFQVSESDKKQMKEE